ncbi:MAG: hypothetical protein ACYC35_08105 [Pirellulales bacterium]
MFTHRCCVGLLGAVCVFFMGGVGRADITGLFSDGFEASSIDADLWSEGGRPTSASGPSSWGWSQTQQHEPGDPDGYLGLHIWGQPQGNSNGALSWVRTRYDYNDGLQHLLTFTWKYEVAATDPHVNQGYFQISDGNIPTVAEQSGAWFLPPVGDLANTQTLFWQGFPARSAKQTWSVMILPTGTAQLYDGPDGTGSQLSEVALGMTQPWHFQAVAYDAASDQYPGDTWLKLYDFTSSPVVPEPSALVIWSALAVIGIAWSWRPKQ